MPIASFKRELPSAVQGAPLRSRVSSAASTNATSVKASAGSLAGFCLSNTSAAKAYVKFYDKATAPTVGTDTPVLVVCLQIGQTLAHDFMDGVAFASGIAYAITAGVADSDTAAVAANDVIGAVFYK